MNSRLRDSRSDQVELFLSRAYSRIQRITLALSVASAVAATLSIGWRSGLGLAIGSAVAYLNLVWLHRASEIMIERMITPFHNTPSKFRLIFAFAGRYALVIVVAYVILKGFPGIRLGFMVGLALPILAATCEGIYEVFMGRRTTETLN